MQSLKNTSVIITGASLGLGLELAKAFAVAGAKVAICAREAKSLQAAHQILLGLVQDPNKVLSRVVDVAVADQCQSFVREVQAQFGPVQVLINNAGVYGPLGTLENLNLSDWVHAIEINLLGAVYMCQAVIPQMKLKKYGKIIQISGGGATNPMPRMTAYAASKAAVVRFAESLAGELKPYGIDVNSVAPGALNTRMLEQVLESGSEVVGEEFYHKAQQQKEKGGVSPQHAIELCLFLASSQSCGISGKLISAVWDSWRDFPQQRESLEKSDCYTIRRIVPQEPAKSEEKNC